MKIKSIIAKALLIMSLFAFLPFLFSQDNYAYASREELLNLEEEKSDIEDEIAEILAKPITDESLQQALIDIRNTDIVSQVAR